MGNDNTQPNNEFEEKIKKMFPSVTWEEYQKSLLIKDAVWSLPINQDYNKNKEVK